MFKTVIRRGAFVLGGSTVILKSVDSEKDNEDNFWSKLLPSITIGEPSSFSDKPKDQLTGWDRLHIMYTRDEFGHLSKELNAVLYSTYSSFFVGSFFGIVSKTKEAYHQFLERNQASQFANVFEARKAMQDKVLMAAFKGMFHQGARLAVFTGCILTTTLSLMAYFDSQSFLHYGLAGGLFGTIHRWKTGPRGMLVGGIVGGTFGLFAGGMTKGLFFIFGVDLVDIITYQDEVMHSQDKRKKELQEKSSKSVNEYTPLLEGHSKVVEEAEGDQLFVLNDEKDKKIDSGKNENETKK